MRSRRDDGNAAVEFVLVSALLVVLVSAVVQLGLALHVRNTMHACAAEGARLAASADRSSADGVARAERMAAAALGDYPVEVGATVGEVDGAPIVTITATAPVPVLGLWGRGSMTVEARAYEEVDRG